MRNATNAHVSKEKDEISSSQFPVLCSSLGETVGQSKTIVGEPDDDVPQMDELELDIESRMLRTKSCS